MKFKGFLILMIVALSTLSTYAQKHEHNFDVEKHHQEQADFFAKELGLTDAEKKAFTPIMQEYIHARFELNREMRNAARELKNKEKGTTTAEYQKVIDMGLEAKIKEAELQKVYYKKFATVLPAEKIFKYNSVERKYMHRAVKRHKQEEKKK